MRTIHTLTTTVATTGLLLTGVPATATAAGSAVSPARLFSAGSIKPVADRHRTDPQLLAARVNTYIRYTSGRRHIRYSKRVGIRGQVIATKGADGALPGKRVFLFARRPGQLRFHRIGSDRTDKDSKPNFRWVKEPHVNTVYQVRFPGGDRFEPSRKRRGVRVHWWAPSRITDPGPRLRIKGDVRPSYQHKRVFLERKTCRSCSWRTLRGTRTSAGSRWSFRVSAPEQGRWFYRVRVPTTAKLSVGYTRTYYTERV